MRLPSSLSRCVYILVVCAGVMLGCDRKSPAPPSAPSPAATPTGPASITLALADPSSDTLPAGGGSTTLIATVSDAAGRGVAGASVSFATTAGVLSNATVDTDPSGTARTTLTTGRESVVTATTGARSGAVTIRVARGAELWLRVFTVPNQPRAEVDPVTFVVSVSDPGQKVERFRWNFGDGSALQDTSGDQVTYLYRQPGPKAIEVHADIGNGRRLAAGSVLEVLPAPK